MIRAAAGWPGADTIAPSVVRISSAFRAIASIAVAGSPRRGQRGSNFSLSDREVFRLLEEVVPTQVS